MTAWFGGGGADNSDRCAHSLVPRPSPCFSMLRAERSEKACMVYLRNDEVEDAV